MVTNEQINAVSSFIQTYVGGFMCILGTIGNLMNILAFRSLKTYRSLPTSAFLTTSSVAGQIYIIFVIFFPFLSNIIGYNPAARNSSLCKLVLFMTKLFIQVSLTSVCLSAIDRYLMTSRSVRFRTFLNMPRALLAICISIFLWSCYSIPSAIYTTNISFLNTCVPQIDFFRISAYLNLFFTILLPISIMSVFGLLTWKNLGQIQHSTLNMQVAKMILLDVTIVAISNIPFGCLYLYDMTIDRIQLAMPSTLLVFNITRLIGAIQACGSFYFYLFISSTFRKNIKRMISKICCFWKSTGRQRITPQENVSMGIIERAAESTV